MQYYCVSCNTPIPGDKAGTGCTHMRAMSPWPCCHGGHAGIGLKPYDHKTHSLKDSPPPECPGISITELPQEQQRNFDTSYCHCSCHVPVSEEDVNNAISGLLDLVAATKPKETHAVRSPDVGGTDHEYEA